MEVPRRLRRRPESQQQACRERAAFSPSSPKPPRGSPSWKPLSASSLAAAALLLGATLGTASAWRDCVVSPEDKWIPATERTPALKMRYEYDRRYTCSNERASFLAASFRFNSPCMAKKFFYPPDVHSCLKGRRIIFLGDSLSNQQGDSLVGMLGWHPEWMTLGAPRNAKLATDEDGNRYHTLVDCWHPDTDSVGGVERCYDYSTSDFPTATSSNPSEMTYRFSRSADAQGQPEVQGRLAAPDLQEAAAAEAAAAAAAGSAKNHDRHVRRRAVEGEEEEDGEREDGGEGEEEDGDEEVSVHMRMFSRPVGDRWVYKAMRDYNETRPSDLVVVNFGAHYHESPEGDEEFRNDVAPILDDLGELGKNVTVVWREISPVHFPAVNGSFDDFDSLEDKPRDPCCTGTPPRVYDRNLWVEEYLRDNGLLDTVRLLRIYDMSFTRGAAHHTCHLAPPSTMDQSRAKSNQCHLPSGSIDCRHWSETGVVEEWNALLLSHVCTSAWD